MVQRKPKTTRGIARLEKKLAQVEPGTVRHELLSVARVFKRSWVKLGEKLETVRTSRAWEDWEYSSFEEYCINEIGIRSSTAKKLVNSVRFLEQHSPETLKADGVIAPVPDLAVVDRLAGVAKRGAVSSADLAKLNETALTEPTVSPADISRAIRETQSWKNYAEEQEYLRAERRASNGTDWQSILAAAKRLQKLLESTAEAPQKLLDGVEKIVTAIEELKEESMKYEG
ncbi:MAG: hypothetical protein E3J72_15920 [Planctomycetota bacterium]|nr:MAG: hypothetical protein E3J72_15920 [Planctomycetota bacterium]